MKGLDPGAAGLVLYTNPHSNNARKVHALLAEPGVGDRLVIERRNVGLLTGETRSPAFRAINPNGKLPTLVIDGRPLFESNAICVELARRAGSPLWPADPAAQSRALAWMFWQLSTLDRPCGAVVVQRVLVPMQGGAPDAAIIERELTAARAAFAILDGHLAARRWMLGEAFSVVDLTIGGSLAYTKPGGLPVGEFPHLARWWAALEARPAWAETTPPMLR